MSIKPLSTLPLAILIVAGFASSSFGQNSPLGDGKGLQRNSPGLQVQNRGLQRDLQVPGTGTPAPGTYRDLAAELRFRNAIVTGNAPGFANFRGKVGYSDPMDFRGRLGSDDLFAFRRDSIYSGSGGMGIRGTDALQYQFALSTGNVAPLATINRGGPNAAPVARAAEIDRADSTLITGALRSSATFAADRTLRPVTMGTRQPTAGSYERLVASSSTGLHYQPWENPAAATKDSATPRPANSATPNAIDLSVNRSASVFTEAQKRLEKSLEKPAVKVDDSKKEPDSLPPDPLSAIDTRIAEIRSALAPRHDLKKSVDGKAPVKVDKNPDGTPTTKPPASSSSLRGPAFDPITLKAIKDAGNKTDTLVPIVKQDAPADLYTRYLTEGQKLLTTRQFFDAEERFALALNSRPGDLAAMVGRLHSQIGAGMRVSANMNLRRLITEHPEMLGMTYDLALMGGQERVDALRTQLRGQLSDPKISRESALILAYLGQQRGADGKTDLEAGLKSLEESQAAMPKESPDSEAEARLIELLKGIWNAR